ncbi:MAG: NAD(P)/FAD-dependent oxidoreductase [Gammaproteobacteria bacterium]
MRHKYHAVIIGGGVLGVASAISLQRRLGKLGKRVLLIEKRTLGAGASSRHSGIVRSAHRSAHVASWAMQANGMWRELDKHWGVELPVNVTDSLWIAPREQTHNWQAMSKNLRSVGVDFDQISSTEARSQTHGLIDIGDNDTVFKERNCLLIDPAELRGAMGRALIENDVDFLTQTSVSGLAQSSDGSVREVFTTAGAFECEHLVNAAGAWSSRLFSKLTPHRGIEIPISMERVFCANFLADPCDELNSLPLIADYQNNMYVRTWPGAQLHMHTPRSRDRRVIERCFEATERGEVRDHAIYDTSSRTPTWVHAAEYASKLRSRFPSLGTPTQVSGEYSYFDITPDLGFILGADTVIPNLHHNLGAGEAMKFAPALGEVIADSVMGQTSYASKALLSEFSIGRFRNHTNYSISHQAAKGAL